MYLELVLETSHRGVLHTSDSGVLSRVDFAQRVAERLRSGGPSSGQDR
jgi:dTDP-4-dehydrorhamnose reductase